LYKELVTKSSTDAASAFQYPSIFALLWRWRAIRASYGKAWRSLRASYAQVTVAVHGRHYYLKPTIPQEIELAPGDHEFIATCPGFVSAVESVMVADFDLIVAVSPDYATGTSAQNPLGTLRIRPVTSPSELQPYRFYQEVPWSNSLILSVWASVLGSLVFFLVGIGSVAVAIFGFTKGVVVGVFLSLCAAGIAPICVPMGLLGLVTAWRFQRLTRSWRQPSEQSDPSRAQRRRP
jgi:hypothetical protein